MNTIHQSIALVAPAAAEPIDIAAASLFLRLDGEDEDQTVCDLIAAARDYVEGQTGRALAPASYRWTLDRFPLTPGTEYVVGMPAIPVPPVNTAWPLDPGAWALRCPRAPLTAVASLTYVSPDGAAHVLDPSAYTVDGDGEPPRVAPAAGNPWPSVRFGPGAVTILLTAGYPDGRCPPMLSQALRMILAHWYLNREAVAPGAYGPVPMAVESILAMYRVPYWG